MEKNGKTTTMKYHYKDRKVEAKEKVTTPAGSWDCYKITNRVDVEVDFPGMSDKAKKMMETMTNQMKSTGITWFSPDLGIVKMELYQNGKLVSKTEIVSIKK
jgi:translation elongation factor EF-Tu-like GTPase